MSRTILLQSLVLALAVVVLVASIVWCILRVGDGLALVETWLTVHSRSVIFWAPAFVFLTVLVYGAALAVPLWLMVAGLYVLGQWCGWSSVAPLDQDPRADAADALEEVA